MRRPLDWNQFFRHAYKRWEFPSTKARLGGPFAFLRQHPDHFQLSLEPVPALHRAQQQLKDANAYAWPIEGERYTQLLGAALRNLGEARPCPTCNGERTVPDHGKQVMCSACKGRGQRPVITEAIADSIGITRQSFHERWRGVYEWLHDDLSALEMIGASQLADALRRDEDVAA